MTRRRKVSIWLAGFLLVFLVTINYVATMFIDLEWTKNKIQTIISQHFDGFNGNIEYQSIDLSILPFPSAKIHKVSLSIPGKLQGTIKNVVIAPKISSLVAGNFLIKKVRVKSPDFKIVTALNQEKSRAPKEAITSNTIKYTITNLLSPLVAKLPKFKATVRDGKFAFLENGENIVTFKNLRTKLTCISGKFNIRINSTSNLSKRVSVNANFEQSDTKGDCEIRIRQIKPHSLMNRFLSNSAFSFREQINELVLSFKLSGINNLQVKLGGSPLHLMVDTNKFNALAGFDNVTYPLQIDEWEILSDGSKIDAMNLSGTFGDQSFNGLNASIGIGRDSQVDIHSDSIFVSFSEIYQWISSFDKMRKTVKDIKSVNGDLELTSFNLNGLLAKPDEWHVEATGVVKEFAIDAGTLPGPIVVNEGHFALVDNKFTLTDTQVNLIDSSFIMKGTIDHNKKKLIKADIAFHGEIGHDSMLWAYNFFKLPSKFMAKSPFYLSQSNIRWKKDSGISFISNITSQNGPELSVDMVFNPGNLEINNLRLKDDASLASIKISLKEKDINFDFAGNLAQSTLSKIFLIPPISPGWVNGDFQAHIPLDHPLFFTIQGKIEGKDFSIPWIKTVPLTINSFSLSGEKQRINVNSIILTWGDANISLDGYCNTSAEGIIFDTDMFADGLDWKTISDTLGFGNKKKKASENESENNKEKLLWTFPVKGELRLRSDCFTYEQFTSNPFHANLLLNNDHIMGTVIDSNMCGLFFPGEFLVTSKHIYLDFQLLSSYQELDRMITCMEDEEGLMTGTIDTDAQIIAQSEIKDIGKALQGNFNITAKDGRIYKGTPLAKLLAFLNLTEIFIGKIPDITKKGFAYRSMSANGSVHNSTIMLDEIIIDGSSLGITGNGNINLLDNKIDLNFLASPLKTVDFFIKKMPIIGKIMNGRLVAVPVRLKGDIRHPKVSYNFPTNRLLDFTKKAIRAPFQIIRKDHRNGKRKK